MYNRLYISTEIATQYVIKTDHYYLSWINGEHCLNHENQIKHIDSGLRLGSFLSDAGWLQDSIKVLEKVLGVISMLDKDYTSIIIKLDCLQRYVGIVVIYRGTALV